MSAISTRFEDKGLRGESLTLIGNRIYCIGGVTSLDFVAILQLDSLSWKVLELPPYIRRSSYHTASLVDDKIYLHGGNRGINFFDDLIEFDPVLETYRHIDSQNGKKVRAGATAVYASFRREIVVFAGLNDDTVSLRRNDLLTLNIDTFTWSDITPKGLLPPERSGHAALLDGSKMYIFGGFGGGRVFFDDLWIADLRARSRITWSLVENRGYAPVGRSAACLNMIGPLLLLFGGTNRWGQVKDEIALFYPRRKEWKSTAETGQVDGSLPIADRYTGVSTTEGVVYFTSKGVYQLTLES